MRPDEAALAAMMDNIIDGVALCGPDGLIRYNNAPFEKLAGTGSGMAVGTRFQDSFNSPALRRSFDEAARKALESGAPADLFFDAFDADGYEMAFEARVVRMGPESAGAEGLLMIVVRDVSDWERTLNELRDTRDTADAANMAKNQFIANMNHELRTPLTSIIGFTDIVLETEMTDEQREFLGFIKNDGMRLLAIINDLLDFSTIESGRFDIRTDRMSVAEVVAEAVASNYPIAARKSIEMKTVIHEKLSGAEHSGDRTRIRQVLCNLINNAVKFSRRGTVCVSASVEDDGESFSTIRFEVADEGIGIAPEDQGRIFSPFIQVDGSVVREYGGTGLGLAISNSIVKLMGSDGISFKSSPGAGSTFHFSLTLRKNGDAA